MKRIILILGAGILLAGGVMFFHGPEKTSEEGATETTGKRKRALPVRVVSATRSDISQPLNLTGSVEPYRAVRLASPAEGPVADVRVREADTVKKGAFLLAIGRKKGVDARIVSLRWKLEKEEENLKRTRKLVESGALPSKKIDEARAAYENAHASMIKAEETDLDYIIRAPWAGVLSRVHVKKGAFVAPRSVLIEMYDPDSLIIRAAIPEKHAVEVTSGTHVNVHLDAYPDKVISGRITRVYPYLDSRSRTRTVEINLLEEISLLPGMFARLSIALKNAKNVITVPVEARLDRPKGRTIFVFEDGKATARTVRTGIESGNRIEILSGIQHGDKVIVAGNEKLENGAAVRLAESGTSGNGPKNRPISESPSGKPEKSGSAQ